MDADEIDRIITQAVHEALEARDERDRHYRTLVDKHEHLLYGNGRAGLTTIVDRLERAVSEIQNLNRKVIETVVVSAAVGVLVMIVRYGLIK
jgi:hypothetical protein